MLFESVQEFEEAAQHLSSSNDASSGDVNSDIFKFVNGCRFCCIGILAWS